MLKGAYHWSLPSARLIQFMPSRTISARSIWIFSSHLHLGRRSGLSPSDFPIKTLHASLFSPLAYYMFCYLVFVAFIILIKFGEMCTLIFPNNFKTFMEAFIKDIDNCREHTRTIQKYIRIFVFFLLILIANLQSTPVVNNKSDN
jgi:hypothetical protein